MRKVLVATVLLSTLAACAPGRTPMSAPVPAQAGAMAATKYLSMDKADSGTTQKSTSPLANKGAAVGTKKAVALKIALPNPSSATQLDDSSLRTIASMTLQSMNAAATYESACNMAYPSFDRLNAETGYNNMAVRFGLYGAKACTRWDSAYFVLGAACNHLAYGSPTSGRPVYNLAINMLNATKSYEDGAKAGYAILETIGKCDTNESNRQIAQYAYSQAKGASRWDDAYSVIANAINRMY